MSEYAPTTGEVRERFVDGFPMDTWAVARDECALGFDRWLAEHDRQVAERAWDEGARWAAVECGAIDDERQAWLAPGDNPYTREEQT